MEWQCSFCEQVIIKILLLFCIYFSLELRELEQKLKAAYMNKERAAQLAEKDAIKYDEMVSENTFFSII